MGNIMYIDIGKNTVGFQSVARQCCEPVRRAYSRYNSPPASAVFPLQGHSAKDVDEDLCFSLVTANQALDLEATSKMEVCGGWPVAYARAQQMMWSSL